MVYNPEGPCFASYVVYVNFSVVPMKVQISLQCNISTSISGNLQLLNVEQ